MTEEERVKQFNAAMLDKSKPAVAWTIKMLPGLAMNITDDQAVKEMTSTFSEMCHVALHEAIAHFIMLAEKAGFTVLQMPHSIAEQGMEGMQTDEERTLIGDIGEDGKSTTTITGVRRRRPDPTDAGRGEPDLHATLGGEWGGEDNLSSDHARGKKTTH